METITPDVVRKYTAPTEKFLCGRSYKGFTPKFLCGFEANTYNIKFKKFRMRDLDSGFVLFEVADDSPEPTEEEQKNMKPEEELDDNSRTIRYHLGPDFLDLKNLGSSLTFSVGNQPVKNFMMIERHYFRNILIKSFEFEFAFCIPNSTNNWESIYTVPDMDPKLKEDIIKNPWETKSDSFYFVGDKLIMHNKAIYNYSPLD